MGWHPGDQPELLRRHEDRRGARGCRRARTRERDAEAGRNDGGTRAIDGVSLDIQRGEFVVLIGLSGSGKSSLLRCINRLVEPTSGRIVFDGAAVTGANGPQLRRIRRRIGMIFQQFNLVRRTSVLSNTLAGRLGYRTTWRTIAARPSPEDVIAAFENLGRVGIADKAYARADALSGGQQQRVGIAR